MSSFNLFKIGVFFENRLAGDFFSNVLRGKLRNQNVLVVNFNRQDCFIDKSFDALILDRSPIELESETKAAPRLIGGSENFSLDLREIKHIFYLCRHSKHAEPMLYQIQKGEKNFPFEKFVQSTAQAAPTIPI